MHPEDNVLELEDGRRIDYDYLVISTGLRLAEEIEGLGPQGHTQSVCNIEYAMYAQWGQFVENPGPIVVGAVQGASCFGPAYEFAMTMETDSAAERFATVYR